MKKIKTKKIENLPPNIQKLVKSIIKNKDYEGNARKPYSNKNKALFGDGPFSEYVAKGNNQRVIVDEGMGVIYATVDHHKNYFEIE